MFIMRYSHLFGSAEKNPSADATTANHRLLTQAGFVHQELAGVFSYLPLGLRVLNRIEDIVREEMDREGAQEVLLSALQSKNNWTTTGRWESMDVLFKLKSQTKNEYALGPTHEEVIVPLAKKYIHSYKDLPRAMYQIQTKFRDELRAKSGIIRGREFRMKDLYSFHATREDLEAYYKRITAAYKRIFKRLELDAKVVEASGGSFTKKLSHEFSILSPAGEDEIISCEACDFAQNVEVANVDLDTCPKCSGKVSRNKGIEGGNIFDLGDKFSKDFDLVFEDKDGSRKHPVIGCYGIGTSRLMGTIVEVHHDDKGIIWPEAVAPFQYHLIGLDLEDEDVNKKAHEVYDIIHRSGKTILFDDRVDVRAGAKFGTADLIGCPTRLVVSAKTLKQDAIEVKQRAQNESTVIPLKEFLQ